MNPTLLFYLFAFPLASLPIEDGSRFYAQSEGFWQTQQVELGYSRPEFSISCSNTSYKSFQQTTLHLGSHIALSRHTHTYIAPSLQRNSLLNRSYWRIGYRAMVSHRRENLLSAMHLEAQSWNNHPTILLRQCYIIDDQWSVWGGWRVENSTNSPLQFGGQFRHNNLALHLWQQGPQTHIATTFQAPHWELSLHLSTLNPITSQQFIFTP